MLRGGDTIAAVATALGAGGVGIIRMSGPQAARILSAVVGTEEARLRDRYLEYGHARDGEEELDEVLYVVMRAPRSFTGEDVAEIHAHGGAANLGRILRRVIEAGARHADPGEFTRRAFENRRIDLTRAEAIADIVSASSEKALRMAQGQLRGALGKRIEGLISEVMGLLAEIEAGIDFPEEDLSPAERSRQHAIANDTARQCRALASTFGRGHALANGLDIVLRGSVNAGKSSLFNALVGHDRAIVAAEAGTTRDYVEASVVWEGVAVTLVDTAGLREAEDSIEDRGIAMGRERAARADLELLIYEAGTQAPETGPRQLAVASKVDLVSMSDGALSTSAISGEGIEDLKREILVRCTGQASESAEGVVVSNERQRSRLEAAADSMSAAAELIERNAPAELVVVDLNAARYSLAEITGEEVGDAMLDELFSRFCIGK